MTDTSPSILVCPSGATLDANLIVAVELGEEIPASNGCKPIAERVIVRYRVSERDPWGNGERFVLKCLIETDDVTAFFDRATEAHQAAAVRRDKAKIAPTKLALSQARDLVAYGLDDYMRRWALELLDDVRAPGQGGIETAASVRASTGYKRLRERADKIDGYDPERAIVAHVLAVVEPLL